MKQDIPTLEELKQDPEYQGLLPEQAKQFDDNYFKAINKYADNVDDYNRVLKEEADYGIESLRRDYKAKYPEAKTLDVNGETDPEFKTRLDDAASKYGELDNNVNGKVKEVKADDMEDPSRSLRYYPYRFKGTSGYNVRYPNGDFETVPNVEDEAKLTEFLKQQRKDKFQGSREGWYDKAFGYDELDGVVNNIRKEDPGIQGGINAARKTVSGIQQGFEALGITRNTERLREGTDPNAKYPSEMGIMEKFDAALGGATSGGGAYKSSITPPRKMTPEEVEKKKVEIADGYKSLFDEMKKSDSIRGTTALGDFQRHVSSIAKDEQGSAGTFFGYFKKNPGEILPWAAATISSSLPDVGAAVGLGAINPLLGADYGGMREYSATLLTELQGRAAEEGKQLSPELMQTYLDDEPFLEKVKNKAATRATVIGAADAILGGGAHKIANALKTPLKRIIAGSALGFTTEAGGETLASLAATGKMNFTESMQEGIGGLGAGPVIDTVSEIYKGKSETKKKADIQAQVLRNEANAKLRREQIKSRVDKMEKEYKESGKANPLAPETTPVVPTPSVVVAPQEETSNSSLIEKTPSDEIASNVKNATPAFEGEVEAPFQDKEKEVAPPIQATPEITPTEPEEVPVSPLTENTPTPEVPVVEEQTPEQTEAPKESTPETPLTETPEETPATKEEELPIEEEIIQKPAKSEIKSLPEEEQLPQEDAPESPTPETVAPEVITPEVAKDPNRVVKAVSDFVGKLVHISRGLFGLNSKPSQDSVNVEVYSEEDLRKQEAAELFTKHPFIKGLFDTLSKSKSFDRIMKQVVDSGYDPSAVGNLMGTLGLSPSDSNRRIITNILGDHWVTSGAIDPSKGTQAAINGAAVGQMMSELYSNFFGVLNYYGASNEVLDTITSDDMLLMIAPDSPVNFVGGSRPSLSTSIVKQDASGRDVAQLTAKEAIDKFNAANKAQPIRVVSFKRDSTNKLEDAQALQQMGAKPLSVPQMGKTNEEIAAKLKELYPNGFALKDTQGYQNANVGFFYQSTPNGKIVDHLNKAKASGKFQNVYSESLVYHPEGKQIDKGDKGVLFQEKRVHGYVDSNGNVHIFKNLTFDKNDALFDQMEQQDSTHPRYNPNEDTEFVVPTNPNHPDTVALHDHIRGIMQSNPRFNNVIFGVDAAMVMSQANVNESGEAVYTENPHVFEVNTIGYDASGKFTMSGYLGSPIAMAEVFSELAGKPSVLAGLYEVAKLGLGQDQLTEISSNVAAGLVSKYGTDPRLNDAIQKGIASYNKYTEFGKWLNGMKSVFVDMPTKFFKDLYARITSAFSKSVDPKFEADNSKKPTELKQDSQLTESDHAEANKTLLTPASDSTLGEYIQQVLNSPYLNTSERSVLEFILANANDTLLDRISVNLGVDGTSRYNPADATITLSPKQLNNPITAIHEIVHAVTGDFVFKNDAKLLGALGHPVESGNIIKAYHEALDPTTRKILLKDSFLSPDYLSAVASYVKYLEGLGITKESVEENGSPLGGMSDESETFRNENDIPYGASNLHEFLADSLSNPDFQDQLSKLPSVNGNSRSMWSSLIRMIGRIIGIPFNKTNLLFNISKAAEGMIADKNNKYLYKDIFEYQLSDGTKITGDGMGVNTNIKQASGVLYQQGQVDPAVEKQAAQADDIQAKKEALTAEIKAKVLQERYNDLQREFPDALKDFVFTGTNVTEARDKVLASLNIETPEVDGEGNKLTPARREKIAKLAENKLMMFSGLRDLVERPEITDNHAEQIISTVEYLMAQTDDPVNLTNRQLNKYNQIAASFSDDGAPVGFKYLVTAQFNDHWNEQYKYRGLTDADFTMPIGDLRNAPFFGLTVGATGRLATVSAEITKIGRTEKGEQFIKDLLGTYKDQIDLKQLEEVTLNAEFANAIQTFAPGMNELSAVRAGLVARLSQWIIGSTTSPLDFIKKRQDQLLGSINGSMRMDDPDYADVTQRAYDQIIGKTDLMTLGTEQDVVRFLESQLTGGELAVLNKLRDIGQRMLPSLHFVKAITQNAVLETWANYVHDSSTSPKEKTQGDTKSPFNQALDVLNERKGIQESRTYPILDIRSVGKHQIKASTYEKHTGVERHTLFTALKPDSNLSNLLDRGNRGNGKIRPISDRLRNLMGAYHNTMTKSGDSSNEVFKFLDALVSTLQASVVVGPNPFIRNKVSSLVTKYLSTIAVSPTAFKNVFTYDNHKDIILPFLETNFPTQYNRTSQYDVMPTELDVHGWKDKVKSTKAMKDGVAVALRKTMPSVPRVLLEQVQDRVFRKLGELSNSGPEREAAFSIWTAHYIDSLIKKGTIKDTADFLANLPVDRRSATDASDYVTRVMGYAPDVAGKGAAWNSDTKTKKAIIRAFFSFRQQGQGLSTESITQLTKVGNATMSGDIKGASVAMARAMIPIASTMSFRLAGLALSGSLFWSASRYYKSSDDEEQKRRLAEMERRNKATSQRDNLHRTGIDLISTIFPVGSLGTLADSLMNIGLDKTNKVLSVENGKLILEAKEQLKKEVESIDARIKQVTRFRKTEETYSNNKSVLADFDEELQKLDAERKDLTAKIQFKYFTNKPVNSFLEAFGGYGMLVDKNLEILDNFIDQDLNPEQKAELDKALEEEYPYYDPSGGPAYASGATHNIIGLVRRLFPSEWGKKESERIPDALFLADKLVPGISPKAIVERGRREQAQEALKKRRQRQKKIDATNKAFTGGTLTQEESDLVDEDNLEETVPLTTTDE